MDDTFTKELGIKYVGFINPDRLPCLDIFESEKAEIPAAFVSYDGSPNDYGKEDCFKEVFALEFRGFQVFRRTHYMKYGPGPSNRDFYVIFPHAERR